MEQQREEPTVRARIKSSDTVSDSTPSRLCEFPNCDHLGTKRNNGKFKCEQHNYSKEPTDNIGIPLGDIWYNEQSYNPDLYKIVLKADLEFLISASNLYYRTDGFGVNYERAKKLKEKYLEDADD